MTLSYDLNLFAGGGGLALGLVAAGFGPLRLFEKDPLACETLRKNLNTSLANAAEVIECDLHNHNALGSCSPVRLLAAGVPCQPFSLAGKHLADRDDRNLFPLLFASIRSFLPLGVLIENVPGLLRPALRPYFDHVIRVLQSPSLRPRSCEAWSDFDLRLKAHHATRNYKPEYSVTWSLLEAADFGVPQRRRRLFIVSARSDVGEFTFPAATHSRTALDRSQASGEYWERHHLADQLQLVRPSLQHLFIDHNLKPWHTVRDGLLGLPEPGREEVEAKSHHYLIHGARRYRGHTGSLLDAPSKTIKAGVHGVPGGENTIIDDNGIVRYYTLREAARIQAFPDDFLFAGNRKHIARQIGNAVPSVFAAAIMRPLLQLLMASQRRAPFREPRDLAAAAS